MHVFVCSAILESLDMCYFLNADYFRFAVGYFRECQMEVQEEE